jgi:hypothetical protein
MYICVTVPNFVTCSEERIAQLVELAPWRLCADERHMVLPDEAAAKLPWGLLAGGSWWSRRPARWLKVRLLCAMTVGVVEHVCLGCSQEMCQGEAGVKRGQSVAWVRDVVSWQTNTS